MRAVVLFILVWVLGTIGPAAAQQVLWQRSFGWQQEDELRDVVDLGDGTFLASATRRSFGGGTANTRSVTLLRFTAWGDTIYCRSTGMQGATARLCRTASGKVFVTSITSGLLGPHHLLGRVDVETGLLVWQMTLPAFYNWAPGMFAFTEGPNESLLLCGGGIDSLGLASNVGFIVRYDTLGTPIWATYVREHSSYTLLNHVEMTAQGTILASGTAGSRIFAIEFTEDGSELRRATFYTTPTRIIFDQGACVRQAPGDRYVVSGTTQATPTRRYLGLHQGWAGPAVWGFEREDFDCRLKPQVNQDVSMVYMTSIDPFFRLNRRRSDSSMAWSVDITSTIGQLATYLNDFSYLPDSSAIAVGRAFFNSTQRDFYLARITNMGQPYRPWQPATATKAKASQPAPRPYPNPCSGTLHFAGLAAPGQLKLYGTDGRVHLSQNLAPGQAVDVSALPPGVYGYVLTGQGKVWRGRVVKR